MSNRFSVLLSPYSQETAVFVVALYRTYLYSMVPSLPLMATAPFQSGNSASERTNAFVVSQLPSESQLPTTAMLSPSSTRGALMLNWITLSAFTAACFLPFEVLKIRPSVNAEE